jgi:hypothetical protein
VKILEFQSQRTSYLTFLLKEISRSCSLLLRLLYGFWRK